MLGIEPPVKTGGAVFGDERRLDGDGTAAAEGVAEGVAAPVAAEGHQCRRQRLPQGRLHAYGAVAPLVQPFAAGIQADGHLILEHRKAYLVFCPGLRKLIHAVVGLQALHHGLFDDALTGGHGVQLGGDGVALYREGRLPGQKLLPGDGAHALKQLLEAPRRELPQQGDDPGAAAQIDIQPGAVRPAALTEHTAVFRTHVGQAKALDLVGHQLFQPQQAGDLVSYHGIHLGFLTTKEYTEKCHSAQPKFPVAFRDRLRYNRECKPEVAPCTVHWQTILRKCNLNVIDFSVGVPYTDGTESKGGHIWHLVIGWQRYGAATD